MSTLRAALLKALDTLPVMTHDNGYPVQAMPKVDLLSLLALHSEEARTLRGALEQLCADWSERSTGYDEYRELRAVLAAHPAAAPATEVPAEENLAVGHDLVVSLGDCELYGACTCGTPLGRTKPDQSLDVLGLAWERHVMTEVPR